MLMLGRERTEIMNICNDVQNYLDRTDGESLSDQKTEAKRSQTSEDLQEENS